MWVDDDNIVDGNVTRHVPRPQVYMPPDCSYLLCGGTDRRIRFWNILSPPESHCLGGPVVDNGETTVYGSEWIRGPQVRQELLKRCE